MGRIEINTRIPESDHKFDYREAVKVLNSEILKITMTIWDYYPELIGFIEEMPTKFSDERNLEITYNQLKSYSESLNSLLTKYILEHSISSK
jgi:hypothetical protein